MRTRFKYFQIETVKNIENWLQFNHHNMVVFVEGHFLYNNNQQKQTMFECIIIR